MVGDVRGMYPLDANVTGARGGKTNTAVNGFYDPATNLVDGVQTATDFTHTGVRGQAAHFNTGAQYLVASGSAFTTTLITASNPLTLSAWVHPSGVNITNGTREMWVSADAQVANKVSWGIGTKGDGVTANIYCYANGASFQELNSTINALNNTWYHVALTGDASGNLKCYVNGQLTATGTVTSAFGPSSFNIG